MAAGWRAQWRRVRDGEESKVHKNKKIEGITHGDEATASAGTPEAARR